MENIDEGYDIEGLAQELELELEDLFSLFSGYISEMHDEVNELQRLLKQKDWIMLQRVVHNIKGVSANLGVVDVFNQAETLDILLKKGMNENAGEYVQKLVCLIDGAEEKIRRFYKNKGFDI